MATVLPEIEAQLGAPLTRVVADRGYRGHNAPPDMRFKVYTSGQRRGVTDAIKRELRRRSAVEPVIGHAKAEHRMGRNISPEPKATPPTPCSPPPATTSEGCWPGSQPFGASSSPQSSLKPNSPRALNQPDPRSGPVRQSKFFTGDNLIIIL